MASVAFPDASQTITRAVAVGTEHVLGEHLGELQHVRFEPFQLFQENQRFVQEVTNELYR